MSRDDGCMVLVPFNPSEAISLKEGAALSGKTANTVRNWCEAHALGRRIGGTWSVSKVALTMFLDGDFRSLNLYLDGDRKSADVTAYFQRLNIPVTKK